MKRVRRYREDNLWYVQFKRAPGLAGGIWRKVGAGHTSPLLAEAAVHHALAQERLARD